MLYIDAIPFSYAHFGAGTGSILITNVECSGSESELQDCTSSDAVSFCYHSEDAGVRCQGRYRLINYYRQLFSNSEL